MGQIRTNGAGVDVSLTCRACGATAVLCVVEAPHPSGDELENPVAGTALAGADTGEQVQHAMVETLDEALGHSRNVGACLEAFVESGAHAQDVPAHTLQILAIASSLLDTLDEALATSRNSIASGR